jgi:erythronate-4-phosphate dehydrogenase
MRIVADENIPLVREAFADLGDVITLPGREMTASKVHNADVLLVRSITRVDADLLKGSRVRFVATATIGTDHVDLEYLAKRGIGFSAAPGSNAESVAEYVTAALFNLSHSMGCSCDRHTVGIVGVGNVGSRVARNCRALGMRVLLNDPPKQRETGSDEYLPIDALLEADVITFHVPLTREGADRTWHMADAEFIGRMRHGSVLINSSRGAVVDGNALLAAIESRQLSTAVLDVWEGEPKVSAPLLKVVSIGTPHIAGYSYDGKILGTVMIREAACRFLGVKSGWDPREQMAPAPLKRLFIRTVGMSRHDILAEAVSSCYDITSDDEAMRAMLSLPEEQRPAYFDRLRKLYPVRREFSNTTVILDPWEPAAAEALQGLRFKTAKAEKPNTVAALR